MTDVPSLALCLIALALSWEGVARGRSGWRWFLAGSFFAALACGVRQTAALVPAGIVLCLWRWNILDWRRLAAAGLPPLLALAATQAWFQRVHGPTANHYPWLWEGDNPRLLLLAFPRLSAALLYCGLFCLPVAVGIWNDSQWKRLKAAPRSAWLLCMALGLFLLFGGEMPYGHAQGRYGPAFFEPCHYLTAAGLGCYNMEGLGARDLPLFGAPWFWKALSLTAWASVCSVLLAGRWTKPVQFLLFSLGPQVLVMLPAAKFFDRYFLPLAPAALACAAAALGGSRRATAGLWIGVTALAIFSWAGTADYLRAAGTAWELGEEAVKRGYKPFEVKASMDWCWAHEWPLRMAEAKKSGKPIGPMECLLNPRAVVSFRAPAQLKTYREPLLAAEFFSPLALRRERLYLYAHRP